MTTQIEVALWAFATLVGIVLIPLPPHTVGSDTLCAFGLVLSAANLGHALARAEAEL